MSDRVTHEVLGDAERTLADALEDVESDTARYHIRQAAQRIEMSRWEEASEG